MADPGNPEISYLATRDAGLFKSVDRGATWLAMGSDLPETDFETIMPVSASGGRILVRSRSGKVYLSRDFGASWTTGRTPQAFTSLVSMPNAPAKLFATEGQNLYASADEGESWKLVSPIAASKKGVSLAVDPANNSLVALGQGEEAKYSEDGGGTWLPLDIKSPEPGSNLADFRYFRPLGFAGAMFMLKPGGSLYRSLDAGASWDNIGPGEGGTVAVGDLRFDPTERRLVIVSTAQGVFSSSDAGSSWQAFTEGIEPGDVADSLVAFAPDGKVAMAARKGNVYSLRSIKDREFISGNVYFATGSSAINQSLHGYLIQLARRLSANVSLKVKIEGHTDDVGSDEVNLKLSLQRAESVKEFLGSRGIGPDRIITLGAGKAKPMVPNDTVETRARNRRVELTLVES